MTSAVTALARALRDVDGFTRIHFLGYTSLWPLIGVATVEANPEIALLLGVLGVALVQSAFRGFVLSTIPWTRWVHRTSAVRVARISLMLRSGRRPPPC